MSEYDALGARLARAEENVDLLQARVNDAALEQVRISERLDNLLVTLGELKQALTALQQKPAQRWDALITQCLSILAAAIIGMLLGSAQ